MSGMVDDRKKEAYIDSIAAELLRRLYRRSYSSRVRVRVTPTLFYRGYRRENRDLNEKYTLDAAFKELERRGFLEIRRETLSSDIQAAYLFHSAEKDFQRYAEERGLPVRENAYDEALHIKDMYAGICSVIDEELDSMVKLAKTDPRSFGLRRNNYIQRFKAAAFLSGNTKRLYMREASCLIFGNSKELEKNVKDKICSMFNSDSLDRFNVYSPDALVRFRGDIEIHMDSQIIDVSVFKSGLSISREDIDERVEKIDVKQPVLMTVENVTSFLRHLPVNTATIFLSGYATGSQIAVIKRIINDNPEIHLAHFGDIDAGGFHILDHLERELGVHIEPYHMGLDDLTNECYASCLRPLDDYDRANLVHLKNGREALVEYMLDHNVKLEQERVSLFLEGVV